MTREEEIEKAIEEEFEDHLFEDECDYIMQSSKFKKGILWADQNPRKGLWDSEKVIEWLKEYTDDYIVQDTDDSWLREDDFIRDLHKAMED